MIFKANTNTAFANSLMPGVSKKKAIPALNIVFIIPALCGGGQEKAGMLLCNYLQQYHRVTAIALTDSDNTYGYNCAIEEIKIPIAKSIFGKIAVAVKRAIALRKLKKRLRPDVSIAFANTAIIANFLSGGGEKKIASIRQSISYLKVNPSLTLKIQRYFLTRALKKVDSIVPVSQEINKELTQLYQIKNDIFVHNYIDLFNIQKSAIKLPDNNLQFFFNDQVMINVARIAISKCTWETVKIFAAVKKQLPHAKLILVGTIDASEKSNKQIFDFCINYLRQQNFKIIDSKKKYSIDEIIAADVLTTGFISNPYHLMARSSVFILPSAREGFSNATIEAMACGLPVIISDCPTGPREILINPVTKEKYGILLPSFSAPFDNNDLSINDNHIKWKNNIVRILTEPQLRQYYQKQSQKRAIHFDKTIMLKKWYRIINSLVFSDNKISL